MNAVRKDKQSGFTIVELLIVIVVIAILAAITIVAYNGVQARARDAIRSDGLRAIVGALELYKADNGTYPAATANPGSSGWELSTDVSDTFIEALKPYMGTVPIDPTNSATSRYWYYFYSTTSGPAVAAGCNVARGGFYVLRAIYDSPSNKPSPNTVDNTANGCSGTLPGTWVDSGSTYITHSFVN
jgi:prepilin-type N-terminal cleavage/methylation domain-containing protein